MGMLDRLMHRRTELPDDIWQFLKTPASAERLKDDALKQLVRVAAVTYGETNNKMMVPGLKGIYELFVTRVEPGERAELCSELHEVIESGATSVTALLPFLDMDADSGVVSTAAFGFALLYAPAGDPMAGPKVLLSGVLDGSTECPGGVLGGLLLLGDRRVNTLVWDRKDELPIELVDVALDCQRGSLSYPLVDFLLSWLEERPGGEDDGLFGILASGLALCRETHAPARVTDAERIFPSAPKDAAQVKQRWSLAEFTDLTAPRLLALEAGEIEQRVMRRVFRAWGIEPTTDAVETPEVAPAVASEVEVEAAPEVEVEAAPEVVATPEIEPVVAPEIQAEAPLEIEPVSLPEVDPATSEVAPPSAESLIAVVSARYPDFHGAFPEPLASGFIYAELCRAELEPIVKWGHFDPLSPMLRTLGLFPIPGEDVSLLVLRTNNPASPTVEVVGMTTPAAVQTPERKISLAVAFGVACVRRRAPIFHSLPTHVTMEGGLAETQAQAVFTEWARQRMPADVAQSNARFHKHWLDPWGRARAEFRDQVDLVQYQSLAEARMASESDLAEWWSVVTNPQHRYAELEAMRIAWARAQRTAGEGARGQGPRGQGPRRQGT